ncbi:MAG: hypothetical protein V3S52_01100 [Gemmatimonadota bacterium]
MRSRNVWSVVALLLGVVAALVGAGLVGAYFLEAVVARFGDPDQSLLFWYLPILFLGLAGLAIGLAAGAWGIRRLRRIGRQTPRTST